MNYSNIRTIETQISSGNVKDFIAQFMCSVGMVHDNEEVDIEASLPDLIPVILKVRKRREVVEIHGS
jgi:hypothetical protein